MKPEKIETFSIVAGSELCNARCPFCVSKMTPSRGMSLQLTPVNWQRFEKAVSYALSGDTSTAMVTSKGEATIFPDQISEYFQRLWQLEQQHGSTIPNKELQTNGILIADRQDKFDDYLSAWRSSGLSTVAVSIVHFDPEANRQNYLPHRKSYIDLPMLIRNIHDYKIAVRLSCILVKGFIDSTKKLLELVEFSRDNKVEQLTVRPVNKPESSRNTEVYNWTLTHELPSGEVEKMHRHLQGIGRKVKELSFGATVYDLKGQNVCLSNSLTNHTGPLRQLIFFPNGIISNDWTEEGENLP